MMEQNACYSQMNELVAEAQKKIDLDSLTQFQDKYSLKEFKISHITPSMATEIYHDIYIKFMKSFSPKVELHWGQNELRLFMWILAIYLQLHHKNIEQLGQLDWEYFCSIFPNKQSILFQYQTISLFKEPTPAKKWTQKQDQIFTVLVRNKDNKYKWSQLAKELYISSGRQYFRTPKQCRQRWLNHLDPNKSKDEWQLRQDFVLISHVFTKGKKWAQISKLLKNRRNEHSIKNRFKSLITKQQKLHSDVKEQNNLIEIIYRKYDNHFSKLRLMNVISKNQDSQEVKQEEHAPTATQISEREMFSREVFEVLKSKEGIKIEHNDYPSQASINFNIQTNRLQRPVVSSSTLLDAALKQEMQKEIRADMFLSEDPFEQLKKFFKSKDSHLQVQ